MPKNSGTSNMNEAPNYIFCQHFNPAEAQDRKCCDCFDIKQVFKAKSSEDKLGNPSTDQTTTSK